MAMVNNGGGQGQQSPVALTSPPQQQSPPIEASGDSGGSQSRAPSEGRPVAAATMGAEQPIQQQQVPPQQQQNARYSSQHRDGDSVPRTTLHLPPTTTLMRSDNMQSVNELYGPAGAMHAGLQYQQQPGAAPMYQQNMQQQSYYAYNAAGQYYQAPGGAYVAAPQALLMSQQQQQQPYYQMLAAQQMAAVNQQSMHQGMPTGHHHHSPASLIPTTAAQQQQQPQQQQIPVSGGAMHMQTGNMIATSIAGGQQPQMAPPAAEPRRQRKMLKIFDPNTKQELDLTGGAGGEAKKEAAPSGGGSDRAASVTAGEEPVTEEAQKSNLVKSEFLKKVSERANAGGGISPSSTPAPHPPPTGYAPADQIDGSDKFEAPQGMSRNGSGPDMANLMEQQQHQHITGIVGNNVVVQQPIIYHQQLPQQQHQQFQQQPTVEFMHPQDNKFLRQDQQQPIFGVHPPHPQRIQGTSPSQSKSSLPSILELKIDQPPKSPQKMDQQPLFPPSHVAAEQQQPQQPQPLQIPKIVSDSKLHQQQPHQYAEEQLMMMTSPRDEEDGPKGVEGQEVNGGGGAVDSSSAPTPDGGEAVTEERMRELAEQMEQMEMQDEDNDPEAFIYSRKFLLFLRKVTRVIKTVKCPKTEEELEKLGLSRSGMPPVQQFSMSGGGKTKRFDGGGSDQFKTPWQQAGGGGMGQFGGGGGGGRFTTTRPPYAGRHSDNKLKPKKGPIARQSLDQRPIKLAQVAQQPEVVMPKKSANAWKSKREERFDINAPARDEEEIKYDKMRKEMRGLLNKITPSTYDDLSNEFLQYKIHEDARALEMIIDLIFDKAVEEPHFCPLYSDLCKKQVEEEKQRPSVLKDKNFRSEIITKCQKTFLVSNQFDEKIKELREKLGALEEGDEKGRAQLEEEIEMRKSKEKRRLLGIIRFIAQLYRHHLLVDKIIIWCAFELIKRSQSTNKDEVYIEYAVELLETVGKVYESRRQQEPPAPPRNMAQVASEKSEKDSLSLDRIFVYLTQLKPNVSNRIRFAIMDLEELRQNNWVPRGGEKGPKKIEEVREEMEKEQQENELERIEHEKQKEKERLQPLRKSSGRPTGYGGRSSADRRTAAASATSLLSSKAESRITGMSKLSEVDSLGGLGGGRKQWQNSTRDRTPQKEGSTGPPGASSSSGGGGPGADTAWRSTSRHGTDSPKDRQASGGGGGD